jgi:diguanylate cyclase
MKMNSYQKVAVAFLALLYIFWLGLFITNTTDGFYNYLYSFLFGLTPLIGGAIAIVKSNTWGGMKTALGKAVLFIGLGIFLWGCGELIWSYYNFFMNEPAPYPSIADIGFAPSIFFYGLGAVFLSKVTGAKFGLRNSAAKFFAIIGPMVILAFCYYVLVVVARGGVLVPEGDTGLKTFLDIVYPLGSFVALTVAIIVSGLSFQYLGGKYRSDILAILLGLAVMFLGDTAFSYATTVGTYYNANWGDLLLTTGTFLLTYGVLGFCKYSEFDKSTQN